MFAENIWQHVLLCQNKQIEEPNIQTEQSMSLMYCTLYHAKGYKQKSKKQKYDNVIKMAIVQDQYRGTAKRITDQVTSQNSTV